MSEGSKKSQPALSVVGCGQSKSPSGADPVLGAITGIGALLAEIARTPSAPRVVAWQWRHRGVGGDYQGWLTVGEADRVARLLENPCYEVRALVACAPLPTMSPVQFDD